MSSAGSLQASRRPTFRQ